MNKAILRQKVKRLGGHLEHNVRAFRGREPIVAPRFNWRQLVPVVVVLAGIGVLIAYPRTRNSLAVRLAMLVGSQLMQPGEADEQL